MLFSLVGFSQSRFFVNLNGGLDFNTNKYFSPNGYEKFEDGQTDFNYGLDLGYRLNDWFRFRLEFGYNEFSYGQRPSSTVDILETEMTLNCMDINPRLDFRVWNKNKFELFLSPGLRLEYVMNADQESIRADGAISTRNYISTDYKDAMSGFVGGVIFKYNLTKHLGFTLSPDYTVFFDKLYDKNDGALQRFNTNFGVEWTF
ncbi:MAG: hypothetical protein A2W90_03450 [Bacteroidetes bacterium GWF2_42_66]|nr:MAG: hypothetical protein A2W92_18370 [Bacteroidetes bacterium GWA2_42_15]OFY02610.1 MAG: hypothetical protein A2W89_22400 [Bacteroidetes bacterium GWE2_42_39]OFY41290.1 MAG: hypothetical protein A2W90_03450 [Bacteroidetes bacterium GWF2_42_66]